MTSRRDVNYEFQIPAIFSIISSAALIVTYVLFKKIRHLKYFQIIIYVCSNDFVASIGMSLGDVPSGSAACWFQGLVTNYNYLSSICWTTVLAYEIYCVVRMKEGISDFTFIHIVCWIFPLIVTLLPLSTNTIANPSEDGGWCFIGDRSDSPPWTKFFWVIMSFYLWVWICIAIVSYLYGTTLLHFYKAQLYNNREIAKTIYTLSIYPVMLIICWSMTSVVDINASFSKNQQSPVSNTFSALALIFPALQGFFHSIIFAFRSKVFVKTWKEFFSNGKIQVLFFDSETDLLLKRSHAQNVSESGVEFQVHSTVLNVLNSNPTENDAFNVQNV